MLVLFWKDSRCHVMQTHTHTFKRCWCESFTFVDTRRVSAEGGRGPVCMAVSDCCFGVLRRALFPSLCVSPTSSHTHTQNAGGPLMSLAPIYHHYCQRTEGATRSSNMIRNTHTQSVCVSYLFSSEWDKLPKKSPVCPSKKTKKSSANKMTKKNTINFNMLLLALTLTQGVSI